MISLNHDNMKLIGGEGLVMSIQKHIFFMIFSLLVLIILPRRTEQSDWKITHTEGCVNAIEKVWDTVVTTFILKDTTTDNFSADELRQLNEIITKQCESLSLDFLSASPTGQVKFKHLVKTLVYHASLQYFLNDGLRYCKCTPLAKRMTTVLLLLQDITVTYPDNKQKITITSFGSGSLFQEYLLMIALFDAHYHNLHMNLIDIEYPIFDQVIDSTTNLNQLQKSIINSTPDIANPWNPNVKQLLMRFLSTIMKQNACASFTIYNHGYQYLESCKRGVAQKSDVLYVVDPGWSIKDSETEMANANLAIVLGPKKAFGEDAPEMYIFVPHANKPHSFTKKNIQQNYPDLPELMGSLGDRLSLEEIKQNCANYSVVLACDPFTAFQDLVDQGTKKNAIIYSLQQQIIGGNTDSSTITRIVPLEYKKMDVALKFSHQYMQQEFEGISFEPAIIQS